MMRREDDNGDDRGELHGADNDNDDDDDDKNCVSMDSGGSSTAEY